MKVGTKSILWGAHQFLVHPLFVARAWWKLYGFPWNPRLWVAFFVHDLGYWGTPNMDGPEGENHVSFGARVMAQLFDPAAPIDHFSHVMVNVQGGKPWLCGKWGQLCLFHSRFFAKKHGFPFSLLCVADKLSICLTPRWLYLPCVKASGEIREYMALARGRKYQGEPLTKYETMGLEALTPESWHQTMVSYLRRWVDEHKDGAPDTWTPGPATPSHAEGELPWPQ